MLKWVAQNKYKLMAFIIGLYLVVDVWQHKGQARTLLPKKFPASNEPAPIPQSRSKLVNIDKQWVKGVNTIDRIQDLSTSSPGFECDVYFNAATNNFTVHHDPGIETGPDLTTLLNTYRQKNLTASIWLDIKNLEEKNAPAMLAALKQIRDQWRLQDRLMVESSRAELLSAFSDSGFFTSCYIPSFNPYQASDSTILLMADSISSVVKKARVNALSGYYYQVSFLQEYFPGYPILTWGDNSRFSLVHALFKRKINSNNGVFIMLYP